MPTRVHERSLSHSRRTTEEDPERFDLSAITFTAGMAKRPGPGPFDAAPIVQGNYDLSGTPDSIGYTRGTLLGNQTQLFYANFDPYQGTILLWFTPEISSAALSSGYTYMWYISANYYGRYDYTNNRFEYACGGQTVTRSSAIVAGTSYYLSCSWNTNRTIDGTNYIRNGLNDSYAYGATTKPTASAPDSTIYFGRNAILEGLTYCRRILYDGTYGTPPVDGSDELATIYAAGSGYDPARLFGSWDVTFCAPTNCTVGALVTGTGEAWSMPHASSIVDRTFMSDGDPPGTAYDVVFNGTSTYINCGSGATLDDVPAGGGQITIGVWLRFNQIGQIMNKGATTTAGWVVYTVTGGVRFYVTLATTSVMVTLYNSIIDNGKWHYVAAHYNDTTKQGNISIDGHWSTPVTGVGAYVSDAAYSVLMGCHAALGGFMTGGIAWSAIWNDDHHTAGTDFVPPRAPPGAGGSLVECWDMDEGTGNAVAATVTSPANDGTITPSGVWSRLWEQESTPVIPQSFQFDSSSSQIARAAAAAINDLPDNAVAGKGPITVEGWFCFDGKPSSNAMVAQKGFGWVLYIGTDGYPYAKVYCAGATATATYAINLGDGVWHHIAFTYNETIDRKVYLWVDGVLLNISIATVGNYTSDAATALYKHNAGAGGRIAGRDGWFRISNVVRYTGAATGKKYFVPAARSSPPTPDANTMLQWNMTDGAGVTVTDSGGGGLNGTITPGSGYWLNTCDMTYDSPGERAYQNGYAIGSDGAGDGLTIIENAQVTAGNSYVIRCTLSVGMSGRAKPYLLVYDNIGAANILASFPYPFMTGTHDGANNAATLQDSTARWVYNFVGWSLYNVTDGSSTTVTANTQTTQTGVLAGGTDNDWDTGDVYSLMPPGNRSYSRYPVQETVVVTAPAGCTSIDVKILNSAGEGIVHVHQVEMYPSMLSNGGLEVGAGVPWVPTGWLATYVAGEAIQELATIHSGASAVEIVSAAAQRWLYDWPSAPGNGKFVMLGSWVYGNGTHGVNLSDANGTGASVLQSDNSHALIGSPTSRWMHLVSVRRIVSGVSTRPGIQIPISAAGSRFLDDIYMFVLDDVSLTVTPASQANSLESSGIRIDGDDNCTHPVGRLGARGAFMFRAVVRQAVGIVGSLHATYAYLCDLRLDANNYLFLRLDNANQLQAVWNAKGAGATTVSANVAATWTAGADVLLKVQYGPSGVRVFVNGVLIIDSGVACEFAGAPTTWQIGADTGIALQGDIVIKAP